MSNGYAVHRVTERSYAPWCLFILLSFCYFISSVRNSIFSVSFIILLCNWCRRLPSEESRRVGTNKMYEFTCVASLRWMHSTSCIVRIETKAFARTSHGDTHDASAAFFFSCLFCKLLRALKIDGIFMVNTWSVHGTSEQACEREKGRREATNFRFLVASLRLAVAAVNQFKSFQFLLFVFSRHILPSIRQCHLERSTHRAILFVQMKAFIQFVFWCDSQRFLAQLCNWTLRSLVAQFKNRFCVSVAQNMTHDAYKTITTASLLWLSVANKSKIVLDWRGRSCLH